jgi:hypothetical protein
MPVAVGSAVMYGITIPALMANGETVHPKDALDENVTEVDQFIDPNIHLDKFVTIAGGFGTPANPSLAIAEFGPETWSIHGPASAIETNTGTGGDMVKTGTVTDVVGALVRFAVA